MPDKAASLKPQTLISTGANFLQVKKKSESTFNITHERIIFEIKKIESNLKWCYVASGCCNFEQEELPKMKWIWYLICSCSYILCLFRFSRWCLQNNSRRKIKERGSEEKWDRFLVSFKRITTYYFSKIYIISLPFSHWAI